MSEQGAAASTDKRPDKDKMSAQTDTERSVRLRTLSMKGEQLYNESQQFITSKLHKAWEEVEQNVEKASMCPDHIQDIRRAEQKLNASMNNYRKISDNYVTAVSRTNTEQSQTDLEDHMTVLAAHEEVVINAFKQLDNRFQQRLEAGSHQSVTSQHRTHKSSKSGSSKKSNMSSVLAKKKAQADAAQVGIEYSKKEADLLKQQALLVEKQQVSAAQTTRLKAELEADLRVLKHQKEAAESAAEVQALEAMSDVNDNLSEDRHTINIPIEDSHLRTKRYVDSHSGINSLNGVPQVTQSEIKHLSESKLVHTPHLHAPTPKPLPTPALDFSNASGSVPLNPQAPAFITKTYNPSPPVLPHYCEQKESTITSDLTRFLLKKELVLSRLTKYNDCPESYGIWKSSFRTIMCELQVTPIEQLDLLIKWLGTESSKFAQSIRAASVNNPSKGLQRVWERLDERFGSPELVEAALKQKLQQFPKLTNKDNKQLYDLVDILSEIEATKEDQKYSTLLSYFDASSGINPIVSKLPYSIQEKWTNHAMNYKRSNNVTYPPFSYFVQFIREISRIKNDPSFMYEPAAAPKDKQMAKSVTPRPTISAKKTDVSREIKDTPQLLKCPLHNTGHSLNDCRGFKAKSMEDRKAILREYKICFKCCISTSHMARDCPVKVRCKDCDSDLHPTALHITSDERHNKATVSKVNHGGEKSEMKEHSVPVSSKCTQICGGRFIGKSCGKTVLVKVYPKDRPEHSRKVYAILDDQSNMSLARPEFFNGFGLEGECIPYTLSSCSGLLNTEGRRAKGFMIESLDASHRLSLPMLIECNNIPDIRAEIPTPEVARYHPHLNDIEQYIPAIDETVSIQLLIGRDLPEAHHVLDQRIGRRGSPYAQKLQLGWVIIGENCLGNIHKPDKVSVNKTYLLPDGRSSIFPPCPNKLDIRASEGTKKQFVPLQQEKEFSSADIFKITPEDNKQGLSIDDRTFLKIMEKELHKGPKGNLIGPLPFRSPRQRLPNNRPQAIQRAKALHHSLVRNPTKQQQLLVFMQKVFDSGHAELAPPLASDEECWYLPVFGVYHPKKPGQIRGVFDSSATYEDISLNSVLLSGPDLTNSLLGVLLRFREGPIAVTADIEKMFYGFYVNEGHRNYLRFLWYKNNNPQNELIDYRMCVHVFGNSPSPAVATFGLRQIATAAQQEFGEDVVDFVSRDFYVDDGLVSRNTPEDAIGLVKRTQDALKKEGNLRLHKIASNSAEVMSAFPSEDRAKDLQDLDLCKDPIPMQRSLGLNWDLTTDTFTFYVSRDEKPYTRRGVLSTINSIYDPIGYVAPVTLQGKILLRELMADGIGWDEPLPKEREVEWQTWKDSLLYLESLKIPRSYFPSSISDKDNRDVHVFCDASERAIAAVSFLMLNNQQPSFLLGKAKLAPSHGHTVPRLELCGAVLAVEMAEFISEHLEIPLSSMYFYTDSKVVLGYIYNESRRFYTYVSNRVQRIRKSTAPQQWTHVPTDKNPADDATRALAATQINSSAWLQGPSFFRNNQGPPTEQFNLADPDQDQEVRSLVKSMKTQMVNSTLGTHRFERFSSWTRLVKTMEHLRHIAVSFSGGSRSQRCNGWHTCVEWQTVKTYQQAELQIIKEVQKETYGVEMKCVKENKSIPKDSPIIALSPVLDADGLLRVGGRLSRADLGLEEKNPLIIPGKHHIATLLVRHHHHLIKHQGRHFTEGAVRSAGLWITGVKRLIGSVLHACVTCRRLRGTVAHQKMSDLPKDRVTPSPAFTFVGVDAFGPWQVAVRKTRGGKANSKRWAILFTCLVSRAVHIEVVEEMSASSFINALRRFVSIRGPVSQFRSDRGTNFVGATSSLQIDAVSVEDGPVRTYLYNNGIQWIFNAPHSSHMGGAWERLIGVTRRILDSVMADIAASSLTHEVLTTLMAEVSAIINGRPLVPVSTDPENPLVLSPASLLFQKTGPIVQPDAGSDLKDLYRAEWKRVQTLANMFWSRWQREYLHILQPRRKWTNDQPNLCKGDVVLLKDVSLQRNEWPLGVVLSVIPGEDGKVRKVTVRVAKKGGNTTYCRPISEMILLVAET